MEAHGARIRYACVVCLFVFLFWFFFCFEGGIVNAGASPHLPLRGKITLLCNLTKCPLCRQNTGEGQVKPFLLAAWLEAGHVFVSLMNLRKLTQGEMLGTAHCLPDSMWSGRLKGVLSPHSRKRWHKAYSLPCHTSVRNDSMKDIPQKLPQVLADQQQVSRLGVTAELWHKRWLLMGTIKEVATTQERGKLVMLQVKSVLFFTREESGRGQRSGTGSHICHICWSDGGLGWEGRERGRKGGREVEGS